MIQKVLFLCIHNSARSQMAEGFLKAYYRDKYESYSAGLQPSKLNPYAVQVMKEIGIDISDQYSKSIEEFQDIKFDFVITVCDKAKEACPFFPGEKILHKGFNNPAKYNRAKQENLKVFREIRDQIREWIKETFDTK